MELRLESGKFFVAESAESGETRILACGGWSLHRPGSREVIAGLGHLRHFAVHPDCIGKGRAGAQTKLINSLQVFDTLHTVVTQ